MRWVPLLLVSGVAVASPKAVRKSPPPETSASDLGSFVEAVILDKTGDLDKSILYYQHLRDVAEAIYNIADIERRREDYEQAVKGYKRYLELAPKASDRAAVQQLIKQLEATPARIVVDGEDLDAVVFIDGKRAGASPMVSSLPAGWHVVDRIGPESFIHEDVDGKPMSVRQIRSYSQDKGNVVMSTSTTYGGSWTDKGVLYQMNQRFTLAPGKYETYFFRPGMSCTKLTFTVPAAGTLYVFIEAPRELKRDQCAPIKVTTQSLPFAGGAK